MSVRNLDRLFAPRAVALFGASPTPGGVGRKLFDNLRAGGFAGPVWAVNPRYQEIDGAPCFPDAASLPETPDLAVVATPPQTVPDVIREAGQAGARAAVVITAGLDDANGLRPRMLEAAEPFCLRVQGPNCLGLQVPPLGLDAGFAHVLGRPGKLAFLSQSGALISAVLDWAAPRDIGFSCVVSLGDMADVDVGDCLDHLAADPETSAILMYLEQVTHAAKFMSAARSAARAKPVVAIKSGRSQAAAKAAASHTGALAGVDAVYDAAFRRAGILRVLELEDLFDAAEALTRGAPVAGDRLAIVTNGGGAGVLAVDALEDAHGNLADVSEETIAALNRALPATWSKRNPVDVIGDAGPERYEAAMAAVLEDPNVDAVLAMNCPTALASSTDAAEAVIRAADAHASRHEKPKPTLACWLGDGAAAEARKRFAETGRPSFANPADAVRGFGFLTGHKKAQDALMRVPPSVPEDALAIDRAAVDVALAEAKEAGRALLTEPEAKALLAAAGIACGRTEIARDAEEVERLGRAILDAGAEALAVKILSEDISHKSDVGGVRLNLDTAEEARAAAEAMREQIAKRAPKARLQGFTVQEMVRRPGAHELILGLSDDDVFGPVMLFGSGGTSVEVVDDKALALPPLDLLLARDMIERTRISKLLKGYRDRPAVDLDAVALTLVKLSQLAAETPQLKELDINPLLADADGVVALDARVVVDHGAARDRGHHPRFVIRPYPSEWDRPAELRDGSTVRLRPVRPEDEALYDAFFAKLDPEDVRLRLFTPAKALSHAFLARLTQIDYARAMAFVAVNDDGELLGVSRLIADPDLAKAEYAVIVRSDLKGRGVGWALMNRLMDYARAEGIGELRGAVLKENRTMLTMCAELGFETESAAEELGAVTVRARLNP